MTLNHWVEGSIPSEVTNKKSKKGFDFVAQLVEQMTLNHWVEGSIPSEVTIHIELFSYVAFRDEISRKVFLFNPLAFFSCYFLQKE